MKKTLAIVICSLPLALAPAVYAQGTGAPGGNTAGTGATGASPSGSSGTGAAQGGATAGSMGSSGATPATPPAASSSADTTAPAAAPSSSAPGQSAASADAVSGWSVKKKFMGKTVYNENDEKIGDINDMVMSNDGKITYVVIGAGGFIGMGEHNVAIPYDKITASTDKITLQGYTKDQLKAMPKFETAEEKSAAAPGAAPGGIEGAVTK